MSQPVADRPPSLPDDLRALAEPPRWLRVAADASEVTRALRRRVPEIASGGVDLRACEVRRVRIKSDGCSGLYRVRVRDREAAPERVIELHGDLIPPGRPPPPDSAARPFGDPGWRSWLPELRLVMSLEPPDTALRALPALMDPAAASRLIERAVRRAAPEYADFRVRACRPHVARYKPGSRCTVVYELDLPAGAPARWPRAVVAKTYHGDKGRTAFDGMRALWASRLPRATVAIAEPVGFLAAENVLVQRVIPHSRTLKELLCSSLPAATPDAQGELDAAIERAAHGLAALHRIGAHADRTVTWDDHVAEIRELIGRVSGLTSSVAGSARALLEQQSRLAAAHPAQPAVPAHGTFRPAQVVLDGPRIGFIDFDGFCLAEPAMDVALFRASLRDAGLRALEAGDRVGADGAGREEGLTLLDAACERFLAVYEQAAPISRRRVALWETGEALIAVLHCWTKVKFDRLSYRLALLQRRLAEVGE
ncbi:MAG TPA: phosphotransferase [Gaiellales bacterium]|jgi:hypothetical protein|nr:phosphotransferase [Gaiellales bacterium]